MNRARLLVPALIAATVFAACGGDDDASDTTVPAAEPAGSTAAPAAAGTTFGDADVEFAQAMIAHHEQAIEMTEMALDPTVGASAEVVDLAGRIQATQDPEIELMTSWLEAWGQPVQMDTSDGHDMSEMEGMMSVEDMDALAATTGADFDAMWLEMMIEHHEGAVSMAEDVQAAGANPDVLALADQIVATQQAEIEEMQALLGG